MSIFESQEKEVLIPGPQGQLQAVIQAGKAIDSPRFDDQQVVIVCHPHPLMEGSMHNKVVHTCCRTFRDLGVKSVRFNFRGVEKSEGEYADGIGETEDLLAVVNWVQKEVPGAHCYIAGFSFGSFVATNGVKKLFDQGSAVDGLIAIAPPVSRMDFDQFLPMPLKTLVIMGEADEVVDPQVVFDWCAKDEENLHLVKMAETSHFFHGKLTQLKSIVTDYLDK